MGGWEVDKPDPDEDVVDDGPLVDEADESVDGRGPPVLAEDEGRLDKKAWTWAEGTGGTLAARKEVEDEGRAAGGSDGCGEGGLEGLSPEDERGFCSGEIVHSSPVGGAEGGGSLFFWRELWPFLAGIM